LGEGSIEGDLEMPRKPIVAIIDELKSWLPNYDHGPEDYPTLLWRILASVPGGDRAEDMGYEPFSLGWQEVEQLGRVLEAIQDKQDVEDLIDGLLGDEEEEAVEEQRRRRRLRELPVRAVRPRAALAPKRPLPRPAPRRAPPPPSRRRSGR
jgi:hypothetical protein